MQYFWCQEMSVHSKFERVISQLQRAAPADGTADQVPVKEAKKEAK